MSTSASAEAAREFALDVHYAPDGRTLGACFRVNGVEYTVAPGAGWHPWEIIGGERETPFTGCAALTPASILAALRELGHVA